MPTLHVCALSRLPETVAETGARHVVTLINVGTPVTRPAGIAETDHLFVGISDITDALDGHVLPDEAHVQRLLDFVRAWGREQPLVIHCYAGISRSTAAAFITACALRPDRDEAEIARELRQASPSATPNRRLVAVADALLGRDGRMVTAIAAIGRGSDAFEGEPFHLTIE
ncbi:tyrosine phosphatase family protein [Methylobacterium frigidaeris]|uniref:Tyrosine specific protein phosphatases domain-containing protein n=1 Tax=Methylobacterium frigidaeris TaxID=2038277 RepID=A0AA37HIA5_9HYPH|nr:tyrosine phosphatase family protein [Methylobacterium frigidaeris]PIK70341.1 protein tyrosine phosphatase [Methylobacterium frigidaeris]GJD66393.1 hypothetical protein MPEAHAMD_6590 [Methylobacterium frigidaeris]